jgi:hypothetical protein
MGMTDEMVDAALRDLNQQFYDHYPDDYFGYALILALSASADPNAALSSLSTKQTLFQEGNSIPLTVTIPAGSIDRDEVSMVARIQLTSLYYHTLETLLRLFLAHHPDAVCPWIEMSGEVDFRRFKSKVTELKQISGEWSGSADEDEWFRIALLPSTPPDDQTVSLLSAAKQWIRFAAGEVLDGPFYNAFKHGMAIQAGEAMVALYPQTTGPSHLSEQPTEPVLKADGDSVAVLRFEKVGHARQWHRETRWLNHAESATMIFLVQQYIQAILKIGAFRFLGRLPQELHLPSLSPSEVSKEGRSGVTIKRMTMSLGLTQIPVVRDPSAH